MSEFAAIRRIAAHWPSVPAGELWIGDDAAIVRVGASLVAIAADALVEGVHFDLTLTTIADAGWKALAVNISDLAAMGCVASRATITVSGPPDTDIDALYLGVADASAEFACPVVGGDLTNAPLLVVSVTVVGDAALQPAPVTRRGALPGDEVLVTGPLGAAAAGLHARRWDVAHARPVPRTAEGTAARELGATAMIDVSDGFAADLGHILDDSGVGLDLVGVPIAEGATEGEAIAGGDDYELVFTAPLASAVANGFAARGLRPPIRVGSITASSGDRPLPADGWTHHFHPTP